MEGFNYKEFCKKQVEWYKHEVEWYTEQIAWETKQIERNRKEDRELVEYIWSKGPIQEIDVRIYGRNGKGTDGRGYKGKETKQSLANRKRYYLKRKHNMRELAEYEKKLEAMA